MGHRAKDLLCATRSGSDLFLRAQATDAERVARGRNQATRVLYDPEAQKGTPKHRWVRSDDWNDILANQQAAARCLPACGAAEGAFASTSRAYRRRQPRHDQRSSRRRVLAGQLSTHAAAGRGRIRSRTPPGRPCETFAVSTRAAWEV
jgi:hypothetical protein